MDKLLYKHLDRLLEDPDIEMQIERLATINGGPLKITAIFKYGLDGSSSGPRFKQALVDIESRVQGCCFSTLMVPLQLVTAVKGVVHLIWQNCWCKLIGKFFLNHFFLDQPGFFFRQ